MNQVPEASKAHMSWNRLAERVAQQDWPQSTLYVVATPIGNLGDFSLRGWHALSLCDVIAAEDTRATRPLLDAWGIDTALMAAHRHNEAGAAERIVERLAQGQRVALVSDAGAPGISDPGARVVRVVREAGYRVIAIPGASAVVALLMASGVTTDENPSYAFAGFAPPKTQARQKWLESWCKGETPVVLYEAPHRLRACLRDLHAICGDERLVTIGRELTKRFEEVATLRLAQAEAWLEADTHREQGELALVVHAPERAQVATGLDESVLKWLDAALESLSVRDAVKLVTRATGLPKDIVYSAALARNADREA
ncbi:16S rRNA (cytidine(1402)-2'-O)-methyltransferase [Pusillimonas sp. CC-YST705]|uniref:Ribosomal RNA small subunit methyltransferase I n=1 Tax=Mesopusillimonas faecipullorum TaxID=2755040 RepID=A0ABS8CCE0_9BURK|nr:16S rRNA (cytidine(1402)-2'-O)-methyltransferase [Mesopusillimonas faecipullorum]MCB5363689.1 16S rRNA (cytidine(1402)-2'-O)-methyltransferase [Mesopusillimonas faecipullorum]